MITVARRRRPPAFAHSRGALVMVLAATLVFGAALAAAAVKVGKYSGTTSEGGPVTLTVAANKKTITHFNAVLGYNGKCGQGGGPGLTAAPASLPIAKNGGFARSVTLSLTGIANPIHDPGRVFGKVSGSTVTGTIEQFLGGKVNKCYVETFTAHVS
ncbi:MAG TPA: hypothetical protein VK790_04875 [Solirubrobacteraceae bacterium]|jgi:hypothetical protein|nr:hypothetical protein [Solirubrobacteraceae bacterium]